MLEKNYILGTNLHIYSDRDKFSFGIDAILLSSFCKVKTKDIVLEIGGGTGIISLRVFDLYSPSKIHCVEIQKDNFEILLKNIKSNNLEQRIHPLNKDINDCYDIFEENSLDVIVTNPPYFKYGCGIENENENKLISRYEKYLKLEDIFKFSKSKLKELGKLFMVNRPQRLVDLFYYGRKYRIEPKRIVPVLSRREEKPQFVLVEFVKNAGEFFTYEKPLIIYEDGGYRKEIIDLYDGK
ncbi:tRNA1(Val) (adenine(37)-N6)-methyltransferase [Lagierella sp.]|uniref:tRNA1(Val) (adenine(37)-N6)-methyltransferase n=1 Tax=Lagierella sp. TaxID=2849657 RepID=UPI0026122AE2|nr:tRNA1(Val) (adenine(37)-N6)-methyltransferase [Lagierella sp.]